MFIQLWINSVRAFNVTSYINRWIIIVYKKAANTKKKKKYINWFHDLRATFFFDGDPRMYTLFGYAYCFCRCRCSQLSDHGWFGQLFCITFTWNLINYTVNVFVCLYWHGVWALTILVHKHFTLMTGWAKQFDSFSSYKWMQNKSDILI